MKKWIKDQKGFSLMEISVALIVMGILVAGTIKGYALIESAQLKTVVKDINQYRMAVNVFKDQYGALPGDYGQANQTIRSDLINGNGNGRIEGEGLGNRDSEAVNFWQHLAAAGLISSPGNLPDRGGASFGQGVPKAKIGGGLTVVQNPVGPAPMYGVWFLLGEKNKTGGDGAVLTPKQAVLLLKQLDTPDPLSGDVRIAPGTDVAYEDCLKQGQINKEVEHPSCIAYFKI